MSTAAAHLAEFAAKLRFEDIPALDRLRARQCLIDTVGVSLLGARLPWGRMLSAYAHRYGGGATSSLIGESHKVSAPMAALANGVYAHGFELDSLRKPGAGVHPGAALVPCALALAEELAVDGKHLLTALVAGCEVMFRIGLASKHSSEQLGFHAPGLTGPFGSATVAGHLLQLDAPRMCHALGIAGSLCAGVLAFAQSGNGSMVKRLHLGRAAEAGILAARLAHDGFEGPDAILEGKFGFLETYCAEADPALLTRGLGIHFETRNLCLKRYPCHVTAHTAVQSVATLRREHNFGAGDVARVTVRASRKVLDHHSERNPTETMAAQYSVPWCVAVALVGDPVDPEAYGERGLRDSYVRQWCRSIELEPLPGDEALRSSWASEVLVRLRDGRELTLAADDFKGTPTLPLTGAELREKFMRCAGTFAGASALFEQLDAIESLDDVRALGLG
jgi:2-methylcitrate dehydratase PrpD